MLKLTSHSSAARAAMQRAPLIFINGRFLTQRTTGVQRYALETLRALDALMD